MGTFLVTLNANTPSKVLQNSMNSTVVEANSAADARLMASYASIIDAADWANSTAIEIVTPSDMLGWQLRVVVINTAAAAGSAPLEDKTYVGIAADSLDLMGTGIASLLATNASLTSTYDGVITQTLTIATVGDAVGDHMIHIGMFPPGADTSMETEKGGITGFFGTVTDQGIVGAVLTVVFSADSYVVPSVPVLVKV